MKINKKINIIGDKCGTFEFDWYEWFVGYTDGDGCFNIYTNLESKKITLTFKISQKSNNEQVLHHMKKELGVGSIRTDKSGMSHFLVRDQIALKNVILPLFDKYELQTNKRNSYDRFKKCFLIWTNSSKTQLNKILEIGNTGLTTHKNVGPILSKSWIIGFIEAEGSFYLTQKDTNRLVHSFGISQKLDKPVLEEIKKILKLKEPVRWNRKGFWRLDTSNGEDVKLVKDYFFKTMKSRKSLIYRIWARSFRHKNHFLELLEIREKLRRLY